MYLCNLNDIIMNTTELYISPNFDKNERLQKDGHTERCVCCNKPMKPEQVKFMVHMTTDWHAVDCEDVSNSQGMFPIGTECKKNMSKEFIFKV